MKALGRILGIIGLVLTVIPSFLVFSDTISIDGNKAIVLVGTVCWFIGAPLALKKQ